jgi:methylisocitrate lyase
MDKPIDIFDPLALRLLPDSLIMQSSRSGGATVRGTTAFRQLLQGPGITVVPGVYDALSAAIAQEAGFAALAITGAGLSVTHGYPDLGYLTLTEVVERARAVARGTALPVMVDADTGYGGVLNVARTVTEFEVAGMAALHLEDQPNQKRCGLLGGVQVVETAQMQARIRAAVASRRDPDFCVIARTDVRAVAGIDEVIARANAYVEAGADASFLFDLHSRDELALAAREIPGPKITHVSRGAKMAPLRPAELADLGYQMVLYPLTPLQTAAHAIRQALLHLRDDARLEPLFGQMVTPAELYELVGLSRATGFASRYEVEGL